MQIADRVLKLEVDGAVVPIAVRIFAPRPVEEQPVWLCDYEIDWPMPRGLKKSHGAGVDGVQALLIAMQKIGAEIYTSEFHASGRLYMERPGGGYGFPVTANMRDMLVGEDALFEG